MGKLRGTFAVMVTPFTQDEQLDEKGFRKTSTGISRRGYMVSFVQPARVSLPVYQMRNSGGP